MSGQGAVGKGSGEIVAINSIVIFHTDYHREVIVAIYVGILLVTEDGAWQFLCIPINGVSDRILSTLCSILRDTSELRAFARIVKRPVKKRIAIHRPIFPVDEGAEI